MTLVSFWCRSECMSKTSSFSKTLAGAMTLDASVARSTDPETTSLSLGEIIQGVFKVERFVASGGMGQVFQARDLRLERPVAIKVLHGSFQHSEQGLPRFQREARALSRVVHPNVVATYEVGTHRQSPYLVMEYVDGPTLGKYVRSRGQLDVEEAIRLTLQITSGLEEAHALGIVHRDVKPGNILLHRLRAGGLLAKVVDFGLAVALEEGDTDLRATQQPRHEIVGSPLYMSPEQIRGEELTGASDQYSLAVVLYEMLTGKPPFVGDTLRAIFERHQEDPYPPLEMESRDVDLAKLNSILERAMAKEKSERYPSISAFATALREVLGEETSGAGESYPCDVCTTRVHPHFGFCRGCGTPVPMKNCRVCGAERVGKRYNCIQCSASLLIRPGHRGQTVLGEETAIPSEDEMITSLGVVVSMEATLENPLSNDWKWMVEQFRTTVEREHGYTVAIVGTEVFAYFGMGGMKEREVERAVDASLFVMDGILRRFGQTEVRFAVEVGAIDTAETGMSWGTARMSGPGVQTVRRLIRKAPEAGVFVGPNVWREVRSLYESVSLSGMHKLLNRRRVAILREPSMVAGQTVPLVGRDYEIEHLERALQRVSGTGRLVVVPVLGPAGIGKSRLLSEFLNQLNQRSERCEVDVGHCIPSNEGVPFAPFRSSFRNRYRLHGEEDPHAIDTVLKIFPGFGICRPMQRISAFVTWPPCWAWKVKTRRPKSGDAWNSPGDHSQDVAFDAYCDYVRSMTENAPYVLALDDLQWIRPSSAKLLSTIATHCADRPVLVILTVRQKDAPQMLGNLDLNISAVSSIELGALSLRHVEQLVGRLFGEGVLDKALLGTLHELSNGIPQELEGHLEALVEGESSRKLEHVGRWKSGRRPRTRHCPEVSGNWSSNVWCAWVRRNSAFAGRCPRRTLVFRCPALRHGGSTYR